MKRKIAAVVFAVLLAAAALPSGTGATTTGDTWTIDDDHDLASDAAIERYETNGVARANLNQFDATLSVADDHDNLNVSGMRSDSTTTWVQLDYRESITRTVRIYIPSEYVLPYRETELESVEESATASLKPVDDRNYTAIEFDVDGPGTYTFALNDVRGGISEGRQQSRDLVENSTGWTVPSLGGAGQWQYIKGSELAGTSSAQVNLSENERAVLQYQAGANESEDWLTVPKCDGNDHTVCYYTKTGVNNTVFIRSGVDDPPQVRYKTSGGGVLEKASAYIREATRAASQAVADVKSLFGIDGNG